MRQANDKTRSRRDRLCIEALEPRAMLAGDTATTFIDDFSADTTSSYTVTAPLARPGSALPTLDISGGALSLTGPDQTGAVTQAITFHTTQTLDVGETLLIDVDLVGGAFGDSHEVIGLAVAEGIMTGVDPVPPASDLDLRDDEYSFIYGGFRSAGLGDDFRTDGFVAVNGGHVVGGEQVADQSSLTGGDLSQVASLYIARAEANTYDIGWVDTLGGSHSVRTVDVDLGEAPVFGVFTDMRDASSGGPSLFDQTVDNLRTVYEEEASYPETPTVFPRQIEELDRGLVAVRKSSSQVYLGWRLFATDPEDIEFNVYRAGGGNSGPLAVAAGSVPGVKLNAAPLTQTTDYVDTPSSFAGAITYYVVPVIDGVEQAEFDSYTLEAEASIQQHLSIPLAIPPSGVTPAGESYDYSANDASVGDLDGDGDYEVILKWEPSNKTSNAADGYTGNTYVDAYTLEGQLLWRIDMGINIRSGPHTTQFLVYDFDGDGRSEVVMRTAPGTKDGLGADVILPGDDPNADYREPSGTLEGIVVSGPEYLTVFDGLTGAELATVDFPLERGTLDSWGDNYANRSDRYMAAVAYLDGVRPSIVWTRGIYGPSSGYTARNEQVALDWRDGQLTQRWRFNAVSGGVNSEYVGEGGQSLSVADVDGDGFDEIIYGAAVVDHDGTLLYATELGHGDSLHVSDMIPSRPGLEIFMPHESAGSNGNVGASIRDAMTGELIFTIHGTGDVGRGVAADIDPNSPGYEYWATTDGNDVYASDGTVLYGAPSNMFYNFVVWWDGDLTRELLDRTTVSEWNNPGRSNFDLDPGASGTQIFAPGASSNNDSKRTPSLTADLFGDWREEIVWRRSDNTALEIFTTIIPATNRLPTLMHDTQYREAVAWQNVGYNQPPHTSYFLGAGMEDPPRVPLFYGGELPGDYNRDGVVNAADYSVWRDTLDSTTNLAADGDHNGVVDESDRDVWAAHYGEVAAPPAELPSLLQPPVALATQPGAAAATADRGVVALFAAADSSTDSTRTRFVPSKRTAIEGVDPRPLLLIDQSFERSGDAASAPPQLSSDEHDNDAESKVDPLGAAFANWGAW